MRHRTRRFGLLTCCAAGLLGCAGSEDGGAVADTDAAAPAAAAAPAHDARAAEQAIRAQEARWRDALTRRDTAAIASFYTEDAVYAPDFQPPIRGRAAVSERWAGEFGIPDFALERTPLRIDVAASGDHANEVGTYVVRYTEKGTLLEGGGGYTTAWRKVGDAWQAASYMWNVNRDGAMRPAKRGRS